MNCPQAYSQCYPSSEIPLETGHKSHGENQVSNWEQAEKLLQQIKAVLNCEVKAWWGQQPGHNCGLNPEQCSSQGAADSSSLRKGELLP